MIDPVKLLDRVETPLGELSVVADSTGCVHALGFSDGHARRPGQLDAYRAKLARASDPGGVSSALRAYFAGELRAIDGLQVSPAGTEFQQSVWRALREIPCGETRSYGDIARRIGKPAAVRAVGLANGANPIWLLVPCHRVIGANGSLTGYAGGLERKRWLLAHEQGARGNLELPFAGTVRSAASR